jgi:DNA replicative helicase MCM subunit Mcm2 (Cdc46/Mcm family)
MAAAGNNELVKRFEQFFQDYYRDDIGDLARKFPTDRRSLYVDWEDLYRFDPDLADDYLSHPEDLRQYAEETLRQYDLPVDVKLGGAHVRLCNLPETTPIRDIRSHHVNTLIAVNGLVRKATDVRPKIQNAAFECQRCGTLTRVQQAGPDFHEPHECQGCERQGPFQLNVDQSEFTDARTVTIEEPWEITGDSPTPTTLEVRMEDDLCHRSMAQGDEVVLTGVLRVATEDRDGALFDRYLDAVAIDEIVSPSKVVGKSFAGISSDGSESGDTSWLQGEDIEVFVKRTRAILSGETTLDEDETQAKIVTPLVDLLGWNVYTSEVRLEHPRHDPSINGRADYVLRDASGQPAIVIEAKQPATSPAKNTDQLDRYMRAISADLGLITNGKRYIIRWVAPDSDEWQARTILDCSVEALVDRQEVLECLSREAIARDRDPELSDTVDDTQFFDSDLIETGTASRQDSQQQPRPDEIDMSHPVAENESALEYVKSVVASIEQEYEDGAPTETVIERVSESDCTEEYAEELIQHLKSTGEVYEPSTDHIRTT